MHKWLRFLFKLIPFVAGVAYVSTNLEKKARPKFSLKRVLWVVILLPLLALLLSFLWVMSHAHQQFSGHSNGCAVVFGAAVWKGDQPSHALDDRTQAAIDLYQNGQVKCLVFSGGESKYGAHEVAVMKRLALEAGVPNAAITQDRYGNNTLATMLNLETQPGYVFVSNDFHLGRIALMAHRLGFKDFAVHAAPYQKGLYAKNTHYFGREVLGTLLISLKLW